MLVRSLLKPLGHALGELVFATILAMGLIAALTLVLNGFDLMATARFVGNFTGRLIEASPERLNGFAWIAGPVFCAMTFAILAVRAVDRRAQTKRRSELPGRPA